MMHSSSFTGHANGTVPIRSSAFEPRLREEHPEASLGSTHLRRLICSEQVSAHEKTERITSSTPLEKPFHKRMMGATWSKQGSSFALTSAQGVVVSNILYSFQKLLTTFNESLDLAVCFITASSFHLNIHLEVPTQKARNGLTFRLSW